MQPSKPLISVVCPTFNEEKNVAELCERVRNVMERFPQYDYEHVFIDNASTDETVEILRKLADEDRRVKVIVNTRNFGHVRSYYHALLQVRGDAVVSMVSDLQDPPEMIADFIAEWEKGFKVVIGIRKNNPGSPFLVPFRQVYYFLMRWASETVQIRNFTGFGLFDGEVMRILRTLREPYPYLRGIIPELGFPMARIPFEQPARKGGKSSLTFYTLYDYAMTGFVNYSRLPLRLAVFSGFGIGFVSFCIALFYFVMKLVFWDTFNLGLAPIVIGMFFLGAVQLVFLGILGEYVGAILVQVKDRPHVIERERINFDAPEEN